MSQTETVMVTAAHGVALDQPISTPAGIPDLKVVAVSKARQIAIRTARTYLQALVGFLVAGGTGAAAAVGVNMPAGDFLQLLGSAASLAVAPAAIALLHNAVELLGELDSPNTRA